MVNEATVNTLVAKGETAVHPTLSMLGITKHYDAIAALTNVSFDVLSGEVHALLGENGAGKSTLMNIASGTTTPDGGTIVVGGSGVDSLTPAAAQGLGIAIVHQHPALLPDMTVAENIRLAVGLDHLRRRDPDTTRAMRSLLDDVHFLGHLEDRVSSLSVARRRLLEIAKAFAVSPRLLILDEPTAPLSSPRYASSPETEPPSSTSRTAWPRFARSRIVSQSSATARFAEPPRSMRSPTPTSLG